MIRILIVDDDMMVRKYIRQMLDWAKHDIEIVGEALHGKHAIEQVELLNPDIALVDVAMPIMDGISFVKYVKENGLPVKIIILSCREDFDYVKEGMRLGAVDYLLKHTVKPDEIINVIRDTIKNQSFGTVQGKKAAGPEDNPAPGSCNENVNVENKVISQTVEYIKRNISKNISLEDAADFVHLNKVYLSQLFKHHMKINFTDYVLQQKIGEAKRILAESDEKVYVVAELVGFNNQYHFFRTFRKIVGVTPEAFRKNRNAG